MSNYIVSPLNLKVLILSPKNIQTAKNVLNKIKDHVPLTCTLKMLIKIAKDTKDKKKRDKNSIQETFCRAVATDDVIARRNISCIDFCHSFLTLLVLSNLLTFLKCFDYIHQIITK